MKQIQHPHHQSPRKRRKKKETLNGTWHAGAKSNDYDSINSLSKKNVYKLKNRTSLKIKVALSGNNKEKRGKILLPKMFL